MKDENLGTSTSVDCALIAAISSLAAGLSDVPGFDMEVVSRTIDQYIKNPVIPDIPDREAYEQVLETLKFQIRHPIECEEEHNE